MLGPEYLYPKQLDSIFIFSVSIKEQYDNRNTDNISVSSVWIRCEFKLCFYQN